MLTRQRLLLAIALLACGCTGTSALRIAADTGRLICGALGCPCAGGLLAARRRPVAVDLLPDGGVVPVYGPEVSHGH